MKYLKRFCLFESIRPSDLIQSGVLFQQLKNYNQWEELLYPVTVDYIQEVNQKDVELTYELVQDFLSAYDKRRIAEIKKSKRYFQDPIESCVSIHLKNKDGWSTDDRFIFYKFEDEWWVVEIHLLGSYRYYICDGETGVFTPSINSVTRIILVNIFPSSVPQHSKYSSSSVVFIYPSIKKLNFITDFFFHVNVSNYLTFY